MVLWKVASPFTSDWRALAQYLVATNEGIRFLESRKDYHESPTQHIINVVETMKIPLTGLKDIFIDLGRDDIVRMLNLEISPNLQDGRCRFMKGSPLPIEDSRNCKVQVDCTIVRILNRHLPATTGISPNISELETKI